MKKKNFFPPIFHWAQAAPTGYRDRSHWGEAPTAPIETDQICMVGHLGDLITHAKFQVDIFRGYDFTGVEFSIFLLIFAWALQQCSATALPVIDGNKLVPSVGLVMNGTPVLPAMEDRRQH